MGGGTAPDGRNGCGAMEAGNADSNAPSVLYGYPPAYGSTATATLSYVYAGTHTSTYGPACQHSASTGWSRSGRLSADAARSSSSSSPARRGASGG